MRALSGQLGEEAREVELKLTSRKPPPVDNNGWMVVFWVIAVCIALMVSMIVTR